MLRSLLRFQQQSLLLLLGIAVLIAAVALIRGEMTAAFFVRALDMSGLVCIAMGCVCLLGSFASRGSFEVQYSRTAGSETLDRRTARDVRDMLGSFYHLVFFAWTGGLQLLLSALIHLSAR